MHHLYPLAKGDPLCPLGFHPQVRWPTRCKRCFRDYKEHGGRNKDSLRKDETTVSSPSLSSWCSPAARSRDDSRSGSNDSGVSTRSWATGSNSISSPISSSSSAISKPEETISRYSTDSSLSTSKFGGNRPASSWTSTPDLGKLTEDTQADVTTVSLTLPRRRAPPVDTGQDTTEIHTIPKRKVIVERSPPRDRTSTQTSATSANSFTRRTKDDKETAAAKDSATTKLRRVQIQSLKEVKSTEADDSEVEFILQVKSSRNSLKPIPKVATSTSSGPAKKTPTSTSLTLPSTGSSSSSGSGGTSSEESYEDDSDDDAVSTAGTETTETDTLIDRNENELQDQIDSLKQELDSMRTRCERVEREKSDILLRRLAAMDTAPSKTAASEVLKLQQRVNEFMAQTEDLKDEKKVLTLKVKELEEELDQRPDSAATKKVVDELRSKLLAAETLCEELMDENEDMKKELRDLEEEIEEMQDNFREDQADEYTTLRKELEQTAKNCRILSFKLRKAERKIEQLEAEKLEAERRVGGGPGLERMKQLEQEINVANEVAKRLQKELEDANSKLKSKENGKEDSKTGKKKPPMLGEIGKVSSGEKISRASMTRGGSQEDPIQLLRDLQDSMEREADLREQLRYAEEEAQTLRKKSSRVEDDNESLVLQLKKMATKARSRRHSPSPARLTPEPPVEKDEGISDEEDPAELRLLLELNEQEASVLRRKVEDMEKDGDIAKRKMKDLQEKLNAKTTRKNTVFSLTSSSSESAKINPLQEQKIAIMEEELTEVRKKLIEKERDCERANAELSLTQKRFSKGSLQKTKSLEIGNDQQTLDLKRQLQVIEQEASILRSRTQTLEADNDKISAENKRLQMYRGPKKVSVLQEATGGIEISSKEAQEKIALLEIQLTDATKQVNKLKEKLEEQENELNDPKRNIPGLKETVEITKLKKEVKAKSDELEKVKTQMTKSEVENEKLSESLKRLKDDSIENVIKFYKARTPKKPTDITTKLQMKKMVDELESEIAEVLTVLKKSEADKSKIETETKNQKESGEEVKLRDAKEKLEADLEKNKKALEDLTKELKEEREKAEKEKKKAAKDKKTTEENKKKLEENVKVLEDERKRWEVEKNKMEEAKHKVEIEKKTIEDENNQMKYEKIKHELEIEKLTAERAAAITTQDEVPVYVHKIECLKNDLEEERRQGASFRKQIESLQKIEPERVKLQKELADKAKKTTEIEKKLKETEEKLKKIEITTTANKTKASSLEKQLAEEKEKTRLNEEMSANWLSERDTLKDRIADLLFKTDTMETDLAAKSNQIQTLESSVREERERATDASVKAGSAEKREIVKLREELDSSNSQLKELTDKLDKIDKTSKAVEDKFKKTELELNKTNTDLQSKASELEMDLQAERKKTERMKVSQEKETKNKEQELSSLKAKLRTLESSSGVSNKKVTEEYQSKIDKIEGELLAERHAYEDLTSKYEILEEEHVVTKAQLVMDKEAIQKQLQAAKREHTSTENDLKALRETYNEKQDTWIKEKLDLQERLKELEARGSRNDENAATRLKNMVESKTTEIERMKKEGAIISEQIDYMKKENEELRRKLEDFDKVVKVHRNMTADTSAIDKELQETKNKLFQEEKSRKSEVAQLKLRYDGRVALIGEEIQSLQAQVGRFKRERDTFRHMLEGAQKTIADLKESPGRVKDNRTSSTSYEESEETRTKLASLDQQISCMEDELSEARLEASKLKTELVSERSAWEVKMSEMQSRVNELEEDRILSSGRTKIPGMRTRMELAWQKEREEQHRLLQETSTLARDLRQTLFEVERERDKERLEAKRRHDTLKKTTEEEQDENRKKVTEVQCDLLELRDAHAKLRTTNEKLRREKERNEKEREELRQMVAGRKRAEADEERKVNTMLEQIDELMRLAPDLFPQKAETTASLAQPTPPRRLKGPKSRESSPSLERKEFKKDSSVDRQVQLQSTVQRLADATDELRKYQRLSEEERDKDRARRTMGMRRAASTESDNPPEQSLRSKALNGGKGVQRKGSLYRKSLSLEQTSAQQDQPIWKNDGDETDGSLTSLQSLDAGSEAMLDSRYFSLPRRETSVDSRLSGGSTQSELPAGEKKKKKGLLGKLKKLTKSRSIDDTNTATDYPLSVGQGSGSDISMAGEEKGSKKDLRERLTGMFKKSGSRSSSVERSKHEESPALPDKAIPSTQRPLIRNVNASTLQRPSPVRSDTSQTSSSSRPLASKKTTTLPPAGTASLRRTK